MMQKACGTKLRKMGRGSALFIIMGNCCMKEEIEKKPAIISVLGLRALRGMGSAFTTIRMSS
ncbi:hypothetical protein [Clostridium porci]|uniref:Uncharacterized protein n=1 Tax=Clostridium porci TaxID=2605778 RepID=A0A7X2TE48_9CLOT|nr:hypothetical protein [Clostridium porci]MSS38724.1 hypothetical protein [Clostridium porci]